MDIMPLHDRIIVRRLEEGEQQIGGIIIPDTAKEKPHGTVIVTGNGKVNDDGKRISLDVKGGDVILFVELTAVKLSLHRESTRGQRPLREQLFRWDKASAFIASCAARKCNVSASPRSLSPSSVLPPNRVA